MKGLTKGEASSADNPVLQLFCRQGQFMADPVEGSFVIEDIRDPNALPIERVASTSLSLRGFPRRWSRIVTGSSTVSPVTIRQ